LGTRSKADPAFAIALTKYANANEKQLMANLGHKMLCFILNYLMENFGATPTSQLDLWTSGRIQNQKTDSNALVAYYKSIGFEPTLVEDDIVYDMSSSFANLLDKCKQSSHFPVPSPPIKSVSSPYF
jgi:hypothetical protein